MKNRHAERNDSGQALVIVLVFLVVFAVIVGVLLRQATSSLSFNIATQDQSKMLYGADGGLEWGITQVRAWGAAHHTTASGTTVVCPPSVANGATVQAQANVPTVNNVTVMCTEATGPGSNLFGGYALVTGVGYPNTASRTGSIASYEGKTTCESMSVDAIDPGTPTDLNKITCPSYTTHVGVNPTPTWKNVAVTNPPAPTKPMNGVFGVDSEDVFMVGNVTGMGPTMHESIWYYDGDEFASVATLHNVTSKNAHGTVIHVTNANLTGVWAASTQRVWAVGSSTGNTGEIFACTSKCTTTTSTWVNQAPSGTPKLDAIYGTSANNVYAVGTFKAGAHPTTNSETVLSFNAGTKTWATLGNLKGKTFTKNFSAVFALGGDVWALGSNSLYMYNGMTWSAVTLPTPAPQISAITGTVETIAGVKTPIIWLAGNGSILTCTANCTTTAPNWFSKTLAAPANNMSGIAAGDASDVWAVGMAGSTIYCKKTCTTAGQVWTTLVSPAGTGNLVAVSAGPPPTTATKEWSGDVWAVGAPSGPVGTVLAYSPILPGSAPPRVKITGGPVFNAQKTNFVNGIQVANSFTQERKPNCTSYTKPVNLSTTSGYSVSCRSTIPATLANLNEAFPGYTSSGAYRATGPPPPAGMESAVTKRTPGCTLVVLTPGSYSQLMFAKTTTYYFESGLYYFTNQPGALDNGTKRTTPTEGKKDKLYIIGGMPSRGDQNTIAQTSPCWNRILSTYASKGTGTGVEWILGTAAWLDVHSVNLELFTREGGQAWEGAQGLSIREVPPACATGQLPGNGPACLTGAQQAAGWKPSKPNQLFQVDAATHYPNVFVHGGLYTPDNPIEEFTNVDQVTLGPIDCSSLELSFKSKTSPPLRIEAGTGIPSVSLIATAHGPGGSFQEEAIWGITSTNPSLPPKVLNWWVVQRS